MPSCGVCTSVTFVHSVKTNKGTFEVFSPSGSHIILVFLYQTACQYSNGTPPPNGGVECSWGRQESRFRAYIWFDGNRPGVVNTVAGVPRLQSRRKLWHIAGSKQRCWLREKTLNVYDKKPQRYAEDNRTAHLTARSDKSVAYVTNNKRLYSTFCTVEPNYWQTRSFVWPLCDSRATCFTIHCWQLFI